MAFTGSRNHFNEGKSILKSHGINWVGLSQIMSWKWFFSKRVLLVLFTFLNKKHLTTLTEITLNSEALLYKTLTKCTLISYTYKITWSTLPTACKSQWQKKKKINKFNHEFLSRIQKQQPKSSSETGRNTVKAA